MRLYISFFIWYFMVSACIAQQEKDTLYFRLSPNYILLKKNYEGIHSVLLKKEQFVTSAFGKIVEEDLFFFGQIVPPKSYRLNQKKVLNLKKFLKKNRYILEDSCTKRLDAYKLMEYFDQYVVFFLMDDNYYIKVKVHTSLAE